MVDVRMFSEYVKYEERWLSKFSLESRKGDSRASKAFLTCSPCYIKVHGSSKAASTIVVARTSFFISMKAVGSVMCLD